MWLTIWLDIQSPRVKFEWHSASECQAICSVANSRTLGIGFGLPVGRDCPLHILSQFLLLLLGIYELMAGQVTGIKPLQENNRFPRSLFRQANRGKSGWFPALGWNRLEGCIKDSLVRAEDLHKVLVRIAVHHPEPVGSGGQYLPRNLDRLTETDFGGLVQHVGVSSDFKEKSQGNDHANDDVNFIDFHFGSSP